MRARVWVIGAVLALASAFSAWAEVPQVALGVWTSQAGEPQDAFTRRVATAVYPYTQAHGVEVCATFLQRATDGAYRLVVVTDQAQIACRPTVIPQTGFVALPLTFHTHPATSSIRANAQDMALLPAYAANPQLRHPVNGDVFSTRDFEAGAGYVVASGHGPFGRPHLLRQQGPGTVKELGRLGGFDPSDLCPDAGVGLATRLPGLAQEPGLLSTGP